MNTSQLKTYAPQARRDFIAAVTDRAAIFGLTRDEIIPIAEEGDVAIIGSTAFPRSLARKRKKLERRIKSEGFDQVMEAMAYTWFNRLVAIRYMELHGYLDHGYRVLSHPDGGATPEIVGHAANIDLPGVDEAEVLDLKLDASKEAELYRLLLVAQCNALHSAMPFLFESVDDETELVLPENLLHSDSLIRKLVEEIPEEDWQDIEIIGWLYQFYISEKKKEVIGKVVKSEDIPAATQLFTPNWIVKYMVQNSLGAQWLATYPNSKLKEQMEYYIEPAEQTDEVKAQLEAITPSTLNPEEMTLIDPACGSGHILVEAYDLFKAIYLERGYRQRDVPKLILEKNLYGLDIDGRAAQLSGFALMMKGRADDRRLFERGVKLNVMALVDSADFDAERLAQSVRLADYGLQAGDLVELKRLFEHATTFGSLIQVPGRLAATLPGCERLTDAGSQDLFVGEAQRRLVPLVKQARMLAARYDVLVANPPYLSNKGMTTQMKSFLKQNFGIGQKDTFAAFILRATTWANSGASFVGLVTPFSWMYLSSFEALRTHLFTHSTIRSLVELETNAFEPAMVTVCSFAFSPRSLSCYRGSYVRLSNFKGATNQAPKTLEAICNRACDWFFEAAQDEFMQIPGRPVAYWIGRQAATAFSTFRPLDQMAEPRKGLVTANNEVFVRQWPEVPVTDIGFAHPTRQSAQLSARRWFPYAKGGVFRKWYGNSYHVVDWQNDGNRLRTTRHPTEGRVWATNFNLNYIFRPTVTWSDITSFDTFGARFCDPGFVISAVGCGVYSETLDLRVLTALLCAKPTSIWLNVINPTLHANPGDLGVLPICTREEAPTLQTAVVVLAETCIEIATSDWDSHERSWDFQSLTILTASSEPLPTLESSYTCCVAQNRETTAEMKRLEEENNRLFIDAYGLQDELTPEVPIEQITLTVNPAYRYGGKLSEEEQWARFRHDTMKELVSYATGCMMGRYSLDEPGLIYAHSGNIGFDPSRYRTMPADDDGIIPLTDYPWFDDDAAHRLTEFMSVAWDAVHLEENLTFLADNLSPKKHESSRETIRRYLCTNFFKDHLKTYKKRPIYWLFSSGKQKAFQCLVYLHRYNEGTLSRMRTEYVIPLQGLIASRIDQLDGDIPVTSSTAHRRKLEKERGTLVKHRVELQTFDEKLRHYADQRISLDLDDGVKVNYGKFGDLLAEVEAVTGKKPS